MPITHRETYARFIWNWDWLSSVLPRRMTIGDIDGSLVLPHAALFIEGKTATPDTPPIIVKKGQELAFRYLSQFPGHTVLILGGRADRSEVYWMRVLEGGRDSGWIPATNETVRRFVWNWVRENDVETRAFSLDGNYSNSSECDICQQRN